jgi:hypothetical protein
LFVLFVVKRNFADKPQHEVFEHFNLTSECRIVHLSKGMLFISIPAVMPEGYQIRAFGVGRKVESSCKQIIRAIFIFLTPSH